MQAVHRTHEIVFQTGRHRHAGLLRGNSSFGEIAIQKFRQHHVAQYRSKRTHAEPVFAFRSCSAKDLLGNRFGLHHGRNWARFRGMCVRAQSNCGVLTAGSSTVVSAMALRVLINSVRSESVKPRIACLAPQ